MADSSARGPSSYDPRSFWQGVLSGYPDLRGTGEPGLSLAYNQAMYRIREQVLTRELAREGVKLPGAYVLDAGSGVGFYVSYYLRHGAKVTGIELTDAGTQLLRDRFPAARIVQGDLSEVDPGGPYEVVNAWDVLYHITDEEKWERALRRLARAVAPGGTLLLTDVFQPWRGPLAAHNVTRPGSRYAALLAEEGIQVRRMVPTHWFLNRDLGFFKGLNRLPVLLYAADRILLAASLPSWEPANRLLVARRPKASAPAEPA
jgi:SAM-dependent methyltransferase